MLQVKEVWQWRGHIGDAVCCKSANGIHFGPEAAGCLEYYRTACRTAAHVYLRLVLNTSGETSC